MLLAGPSLVDLLDLSPDHFLVVKVSRIEAKVKQHLVPAHVSEHDALPVGEAATLLGEGVPLQGHPIDLAELCVVPQGCEQVDGVPEAGVGISKL